jgi:hypothetical protein
MTPAGTGAEEAELAEYAARGGAAAPSGRWADDWKTIVCPTLFVN